MGNTKDIETIKQRMEEMNRELQIYNDRLNAIAGSWSYKVGRIITFIPRKIIMLLRR